jgi:hypothetical protein
MTAGQAIKDAVARILTGSKPVDLTIPSVFMNNLTFIYHTMKASENLLTVAAGCSLDEPLLLNYFMDHLSEEKGHAEWLADDLATVGIEADKTNVPRQAVELVGSQYYLIQHVHASALLGYMVLMECFPMPLTRVDELEAKYGTALVRTLRYHAKHDTDHGAELLAVIDSLPQARQQLVLQSATQSARYFVHAMTTFI